MTQAQEKNWIKSGCSVKHNDIPGVKIIVDRIIRRRLSAREGMAPRNIVVGVECHWMIGGRQEKGIFHTSELSPYAN